MGIGDFQAGLGTFGRKGSGVTPSDSTDLAGGPVKAVVTLTSGNLSILPADSGSPISFIAVPVGFVPPFIVRRVLATGTTATVATVEG